MNRHQFQDYTIEVSDDPTYTFGSADNKITYSRQYFGDGGQEYPTSKHGVRVLQHDKETSNCIIIGSGGGTGIHETSTLLDSDKLLICCCDTIFCLKIPDLELKWKTKADLATCFEIYLVEAGYIVHGETEISHLDKEGKILWQFGGKDIFVSLADTNSFSLKADYIEATDFSGNRYCINFNGELIQ